MLTGFEPAPPALTMITQSANLWSLSRGRCACQYTKQPVYVHCSARRAVLYHIETLLIILYCWHNRFSQPARDTEQSTGNFWPVMPVKNVFIW